MVMACVKPWLKSGSNNGDIICLKPWLNGGTNNGNVMSQTMIQGWH